MGYEQFILPVGAVVVFAAFGYIFRERLGFTPQTNAEVMLCSPQDYRYDDLKITRETDGSLETVKRAGVTRFFLKKYRGWINRKGKSRFLALPGVDFTYEIKGKITHAISLLEAVKAVLSEVDLTKFTPEGIKALEEAKWGVTTEPILDENVGKNSGNENIFTEADKKMIQYKADADAKAAKNNEVPMLLIVALLGFGAFIGYLAVHMGWIK